MDGGEGGVWPSIGMVGCKGDVISRVPVFGCDFENKGKGEKAVDSRKDDAAIGNR